MEDVLKKSWNSFSDEIAKSYLRTFGHPAESSKELLTTILKERSVGTPRVIDLGCGNGQLYGYFKEKGFPCEYIGVDFSKPLLEAAENTYNTMPGVSFIHADLNNLELTNQKFDFAIYSHVIEMLASPERSLIKIKEACSTIIIRFFEPPDFEYDTTEIKQMNVGNGDVFYLRRKMSMDYYRLILSKIGAKEVQVFKDTRSKDQIHIISF